MDAKAHRAHREGHTDDPICHQSLADREESVCPDRPALEDQRWRCKPGACDRVGGMILGRFNPTDLKHGHIQISTGPSSGRARGLCRCAIPAYDAKSSSSGSPTSAPRPLGRRSLLISREMLDDLQAGADHMVAHDLIGALRVRADDGPDDLVMFVKRIFRPTRHKLKRSEWREPLPEIPGHRSNARIVCAQRDRLVKFIVQRREILVTLCNLSLTACIENLEPLLLKRGHPYGAQL